MVNPLSQDVSFELQTLAHALRYQQWMIRAVKPYLGKNIVELGAGIGNLSQWLNFSDQLIVTESDMQLLSILQKRFQSTTFTTLKTLHLDIMNHSFSPLYNNNLDTIISFNVLEHIENDRFALEKCVDLLNNQKTFGKKRIITFVPAHPFAYGALDSELGHYRRYTRAYFKNLHRQILPTGTLTLKSFNFVGLWGWFVNGRILKRKQSGVHVVNTVEKLCHLFQMIDTLCIQFLKIPLGQSLIAIQEWENSA